MMMMINSYYRKAEENSVPSFLISYIHVTKTNACRISYPFSLYLDSWSIESRKRRKTIALW
jgi:hypothetical protein